MSVNYCQAHTGIILVGRIVRRGLKQVSGKKEIRISECTNSKNELNHHPIYRLRASPCANCNSVLDHFVL